MIDENDDDFEEEFLEPQPPAPERVKITLDNILGAKTSVRKAKKTAEDKKRESFAGMISKYEQAWTRSNIVSEFMDMETWDDLWMDIIDDLIGAQYNLKQQALIRYFIFERIDEFGQVIPFEVPLDKLVYLDTPEQLYEFIKGLK